MTDIEVYQNYPYLRHWYNKLWFSEQLGYYCGPASIAPKLSGWYIVRPVINLSGMGLCSKKIWINKGDYTKVPPGFFWCEWFTGNQYSVTYEWNGSWKAISCWQGIKDDNNLSEFKQWLKVDFYPELNTFYDEIGKTSDISKINIEFIETKPIEIHLRTSPDPDYNELIPIWKGQENLVDIYLKMGYNYIISYDDAEGFLEKPRIGFAVKN